MLIWIYKHLRVHFERVVNIFLLHPVGVGLETVVNQTGGVFLHGVVHTLGVALKEVKNLKSSYNKVFGVEFLLIKGHK
jgi:hypothetical protein